MKRRIGVMLNCLAALAVVSFSVIGCKGTEDYHSRIIPLIIEKLDPQPGSVVPKPSDTGPPIGPAGNLHAIFSLQPGTVVPAARLLSYRDRETSYVISTDYDGDGVPNDQESLLGNNPFVTDYPRVSVRTSYPVSMEIVMNVSGEIKTYSESIEQNDTRATNTRNMDETHYTKVNLKTTPYVVKGSTSDSGSTANSYGYSDSSELSGNTSFSLGVVQMYDLSAAMGFGTKTSHSRNYSFSNSFARSSMSERTVFEDVNYHDTMDGTGVELKDNKIVQMERKYRQSEIASGAARYSENAGTLSAAMYFKNESIDKPVRISNVQCTALLKLPSGRLEVLSTFTLRDREGNPFEVEIGGGEETPPYAVIIDSLNTEKIKNAIKNGYIPVISLFKYEMTLADDSAYQPGIQNLTQIEENAKGRTAVIKIVAPGKRDLYRVAAFDVDELGNVSPGISLKKALFRVLRSPLKRGEQWDCDAYGNDLTVKKNGQWWHGDYNGTAPTYRHEYAYSQNIEGNEWDYFATEVKTYADEFNNPRRIETIRRIGNDKDPFGNYINAKYNPFNKKDNTRYNENEPLTEDEILKTKYWVILHNGKYFEGDLNDPIWAGDRYEIILFNVADFREHFQNLVYTPLQSGQLLSFDTRWNALVNNAEELARAVRLGRVGKGEVVQLDMYLKESRFLFDPSVDKNAGMGIPALMQESDPASNRIWWDFHYTFEPGEREANGIPANFTHKAEGGVNNAVVHIDQSANAQYYVVELTNCNEANAIARKIRVTAKELKNDSGNIYLNSKTPDINGNPVGIIQGSTYDVAVFAHGTDYNHPVRTRSATNGTSDARITVTEASDTRPSTNFSFTALNLARNKLFVRISNPPNTEYYLIRCYGPFNYGQGASMVKQVRGHEGENVIELDHPYQGLQEARAPGVYEIKVFAVNKNCYTGATESEAILAATESSSGALNVEVEYDQYRYQRIIAPYKWLPEAERDNDARAAVKNFNLNAFDLEVNFNEGSGWYRLKFANDDRAANGREIECRYTSVVEDYRGQHFRVYFTPPVGDNGSFLNVFKSSDEEVDIYIRTVAEKRYRDTFWMKKLDTASLYRAGANAILTGGVVNDFISFWNGLEETDASRFEATLAKWRISDIAGFVSGIMAGLFEQQPSPVAYFFSPLEQRKFWLSAVITEPANLVVTRPTKLDLPVFKAIPGPGCIYIQDIESRYADQYTVWWRRLDRTASYEQPLKLASVRWDKASNAPADPVVDNWTSATVNPDERGKFNFTVPNCSPGQYYVVAVVGVNASLSGTSEARFAFDKNSSGDNISFIMPYPSQPPQGAPAMQLSPDKLSITVDLSTADQDQNRFIIEWKSDHEQTWSRFDTLSLFNGSTESLEWGGTQHVIRNLNPVTNYTVRAYTITLNNLKGPEATGTVITGFDGTCSLIWNWDNFLPVRLWDDGDSFGVDSTLFFTVDNLPVGTASYTVTGTISYFYYSGWLSTGPFVGSTPFSITSNGTEQKINVKTLTSHATYGIFHTYHMDDINVVYTVSAFDEHGAALGPPQRDSRKFTTPRW